MVKVVFLDIDGVLNSDHWYRERELAGHSWSPHGLRHMSPDMVKRLDRLVTAGAKFVVSSSWRYSYEPQTIEMMLKEHGFRGEVIAETITRRTCPSFYDSYDNGHAPRGDEIKEWLGHHPEVTHYVVLDDCSDMDAVVDHLVQTSDLVGLTDADVTRALQILEEHP